MALTETQVRKIRPTGKRFRIMDRDGLYLDVMASGRMVWRIRRQKDGSRRLIRTVGTLTDTFRLADARKRALEMRSNPEFWRDEDGYVGRGRRQTLWQAVCEDFIAKREKEGAHHKTIAQLNTLLSKTYDALGKRQISRIRPKDLLAVLEDIQEQGLLDSAIRIRSHCSRVFRYAVARGDCESDPAALLQGALINPVMQSWPAITEPSEVGELMRRIDAYSGRPVTRIALLVQAYTFLRPGEARLGRWEEVDWNRARWDIPGERMKGGRRPLVVPLSRQVIALLKELKDLALSDHLMFPHVKHASKTMSENTLNTALVRAGIDPSEHVPHGFRSTASTNLHEAGWPEEWVEMQLHHLTGTRVSRTYNRAKHLEQRATMMQRYADWLDDLANHLASDVTELKY